MKNEKQPKKQPKPKSGEVQVAADFDGYWLARYYDPYMTFPWVELRVKSHTAREAAAQARRAYKQSRHNPKWMSEKEARQP